MNDSERIHDVLDVGIWRELPSVGVHLRNVIDNLALIADLGYGSTSLTLLEDEGLRIVAARRTTTAVGPEVKARIGKLLPRPAVVAGEISTHDDSVEVEAYEALVSEKRIVGSRQRVQTGVKDQAPIIYTTLASPVFDASQSVVGIIIRDIAQAQAEAPGRMEAEFVQMAAELVARLRTTSLLDADQRPFVTARRPGDGVMRVNAHGIIEYPSPNAVAIMRAAGFENRVRTSHASELPGGGFAIMGVVGRHVASQKEVTVAGRTLLYRTIGIDTGAIVFVEDVTDLRSEQQTVKVKDATIREVHHRVKNNLQTVAALLRMQARRATSQETIHALTEATDRINSMAVVHALLSQSDFESLDFAKVARAVIDSIAKGIMDPASDVKITVVGDEGIILPAPVTTSLAMVLTELIHNAFEHGVGIDPTATGTIRVELGRDSEGVHFTVSDSGPGLPDGFDIPTTVNLGLSIVETLITQDLGGTVKAYSDHGAHFSVEIPYKED